MKTHPVYEHWYPVFAVIIGAELRVGEVTGLRWFDIDMESGMIDVNHTLVYYDHRTEGSKSGCYFNVNTTKTPASMRQVPMPGFLREAFEQEKQKQEDLGLHCEVTIVGYTDFFSSIVLVRNSTKLHSTKQSEELSVIAMMSSFCTVMNLTCYFLILAVTCLDIHLQQECVKLE